MMIEHTIRKLNEMKLYGMASCLENQLSDPTTLSLSFEERVGLLVDHESTSRDNRKLQRLLKAAKFRISACVEDIDYRKERGLKQSEIASLSSCVWIQRKLNLIITGPTGTGKTWLACALGNKACRHGLSVRFVKVGDLLRDMNIARQDGSYKRLIARLVKYDLLILDDFGTHTIDSLGRSDLLEIIDGRTERGSVLVTSQLPVSKWHDYLSGGNSTVADAILDRLTGGSARIEISGGSYRRHRKVELD